MVFFLAWGQGFEPQLMASKATVLPLDDPQISYLRSPNTSLKYTKNTKNTMLNFCYNINMQKYVVAFVFNYDLSSVLLMHKNRPAWQNGLVNGLGGKVDEGEDTYTTVSREIEEESGLEIPKESWVKAGRVYSDSFEMDVFGYIYEGGMSDATTKENEPIEWFKVADLPSNTIENVPWLIHITFDKLKNNNFELFEVKYKK